MNKLEKLELYEEMFNLLIESLDAYIEDNQYGWGYWENGEEERKSLLLKAKNRKEDLFFYQDVIRSLIRREK